MTDMAIATPEEKTASKHYWRLIITAGVGFFTDAYDLFIIGVVTALLTPIWHLSPLQLAILNGASLASAALGAVLFGMLSDLFGRKKLYGFEILILFIGAILSALSMNFIMLLISRVIVGFGIGGDYPSSAVVTSEHSTSKNRGFLVLLVFAMQALGLTVGPLLAAFFLWLHLPDPVIWRLLLGLGAIPAASVFFMRRRIAETPHFLKTKEIPFEVSRAVSNYSGFHDAVEKVSYQKQKLSHTKWLKYLVLTAGAWFLLDVAFYGNGVSSVLIMASLNTTGSLLTHTLYSTLIFVIFAVPGYFLAAKYVDKIGRKTLQMLGFFVMAIMYLILALHQVQSNLPIFLLIFGVSFFFVNFGPNTTTFLIPSEIFPTSIRAKAHGISAATGKIGAFAGAFILPIFLHHYNLSMIMVIMAIVCIVGVLITQFLPEMKGLGLETTETPNS